MNGLRALLDLCIGTAESELSFLVDAFVDDGSYADVIRTPTGAPILLVGKKGTGKTAVLRHIALRSKKSEVTALYLKPDDIEGLEAIKDPHDISTIKRIAYHSLIESTALEIGNELRGLLSRKDKKLFDKAVSRGSKSPDCVQMFMHGLSKFGTAITNIKFDKLLPTQSETTTDDLAISIRENFKKNTEKAFFLLIDDVDQVATLSHSEQTNRVWGLLLGVKKLCEEFPNIKCIISLRTEIWLLLCHDPTGQRDQVDHFRPLIRDLDPPDKTIKSIILKRLELAKKHSDSKTNESGIEHFFDKSSVVLPTTETETRSWIDFLVKSSRNRPRDSIQFLSILTRKSLESGFDRISQEVVNSSSELYSKERTDDLAREFSFDCPNVNEVIRSFAKVDFRLKSEDMKNHILSLPSMFTVSIRNKTIHPDVDEDSFILWNFIHEMGLVNPCVPDKRRKRGFSHISFKNNPSFVSKANWNEMQKVIWEVHPAYRSHLLLMKTAEQARTGISLSSLFERRQK